LAWPAQPRGQRAWTRVREIPEDGAGVVLGPGESHRR
jgi:hypothetical protein